MKYKTIEIKRPEWCEIGTVVKVKNMDTEYSILGVSICGRWAKLQGGDSVEDARVANLTPVPAWEPTPGEHVAAWDDGGTYFSIAKYEGRHQTGRFIVDRSLWGHIARIAGVDCACSVEELKAMTDWL